MTLEVNMKFQEGLIGRIAVHVFNKGKYLIDLEENKKGLFCGNG